MKKIILLILIAMIPFLTIAQKRTKKVKDNKTETNATFMIIKAVEIDMFEMNQVGMDKKEIEDRKRDDISLEIMIKRHSSPSSSFVFSYDIPGATSKEIESFIKASKKFSSMAQAVNHAQELGWNFVNSNIVDDDMITIHYYYMKK